jgi:hypothetical protein
MNDFFISRMAVKDSQGIWVKRILVVENGNPQMFFKNGTYFDYKTLQDVGNNLAKNAGISPSTWVQPPLKVYPYSPSTTVVW